MEPIHPRLGQQNIDVHNRGAAAALALHQNTGLAYPSLAGAAGGGGNTDVSSHAADAAAAAAGLPSCRGVGHMALCCSPDCRWVAVAGPDRAVIVLLHADTLLPLCKIVTHQCKTLLPLFKIVPMLSLL